MIRLVIVEDNPQDIFLLSAILEKEDKITIIGTATSGKEGILLVQKTQPDVALFDIRLPDISGVECVRRLRTMCRDTDFVMCTIFDEDNLVYDSIMAGANAYLLKNSTPDFIIYTIIEVHEGRSPMSSDIARKIVNRIQTATARYDYGISKREAMVLAELSKGLSYQEISNKLQISIKTLKYHIHRIYGKLAVHNRMLAVKKYYDR